MFAGFVERMEDTRLRDRVIFGELVGGAGCMGEGKEWTGCFLDDLTQCFRYQCRPVDDCSPGQGGMGQRNKARGEMFHGEIDCCGESQGAGLRQLICPNVTGRAKERIAQSTRARAGSLAIITFSLNN